MELRNPRNQTKFKIRGNLSTVFNLSETLHAYLFYSHTKEAIPAEERLSQLLERLESLEYRLNTESRQKSELADEVAQLREENHRLQEESATAAQQLRRFTEWFFQTIEKA